MEYMNKICIELEDFHKILAENYDYDMYMKMFFILSTILGISLATVVSLHISLQNEITSQEQVKKSLMEHIASLEEELTKFHIQAESIKEIEEMEQEGQEEQEEQEGQEEQEEQEVKDDLDDLQNTLHED